MKAIALRAIDVLRAAGKLVCTIGAGIAFVYFAILGSAEQALSENQPHP